MEKKKDVRENETPKEGSETRREPKERAPKAKEEKGREQKEGKEAELPAAEKQDEELLRARAEAEDFKRKWYSVSAEYENYRKRTAGLSSQRYAEGRADVVKGLFPIADNLDRAIEACADEGTKKGIRMVISSFEALLKEENIEPIDPLGEEFNAEEQEAIMAVDPAEGEQSGTVKQVYRKGYKQNGKVLRFAQVVVIK